MDDATLRTAIRQVSKTTTEEEVDLLVSCAITRTLKKGEILLNEGENCRSFYLVDQGYLRTYYYKTGVAVNLNFTFEGSYATNIKSVKSKQPSDLIIEAGENTVVWIFDLDIIAEKFDSHPQVILFIRRVSTLLFVASEENSNFFKMYTPTERYRYIEKNNPMLLQRVSLSQIASYLGVARETLSRIRRKNI
ncbi:MAG: Crp/Fnr family transcriptional regulator [Mucilaginibacter sp.]|uniref:Crp/Fnr family transcriptional regulator n=1 Tax=Mucilaginibacter sp. TaxID=1882438 RepID=UPI0034E3F8E7